MTERDKKRWLKSLSSEKVKIIESLRVDAVMQFKKFLTDMTQTAYSGAIIELFEDKFTFDEIEKINQVADFQLVEMAELYKEYGENWKGVLSEMEREVIEKVKGLLDKGYKQNEVIAALKKEYPKLKSSNFQIAYKTGKEEWCKNCAELSDEDKERRRIIDQERKKRYLEKKSKKEIEKVVNEVMVDNDIVIENSQDNEAVVEPNKEQSIFTVLEKKIVFKGVYGVYEINGDTLKTGDLEFKSYEDIDKYIQEELTQFYDRMDEIKLAMCQV